MYYSIYGGPGSIAGHLKIFGDCFIWLYQVVFTLYFCSCPYDSLNGSLLCFKIRQYTL